MQKGDERYENLRNKIFSKVELILKDKNPIDKDFPSTSTITFEGIVTIVISGGCLIVNYTTDNDNNYLDNKIFSLENVFSFRTHNIK